MRIRWHGHACFEVKDGATVITDPHDGRSIGIPAPSLKGDIVLISHDHFDHNCARMVKGPDVSVIKEPIMTVERGVRIQGFETFHDNASGAKRGANIVYRMEIDGVSMCHLGDLGHMLDQSLIADLSPIDVLFIPVGNVFTLDVKSAISLVNALKPKVAVPMHYRVGGLSLSIHTADEFLSGFNEDQVVGIGNEIEFRPDELPKSTEIWMFSL